MISRRNGLLNRERLIGLLDEAVAAPVTLICAPPGSGKTSLLRTWMELARADRRVVFVSAHSETDDHPFWMTLLAAVQDKDNAATGSFDARVMIDRTVGALDSNQDTTILVIDDAHELDESSLDSLALLLQRVGPHVHTIIATRRDLPIGTHLLRVGGSLAEIRADKLAFTEPETRELFSSLAISLSESAVRTLHLRTEGWAAGLRLAALSLAGDTDPERFVAEFSGSNRVVADYLVAEMLGRQPPRVQQMLLVTSILDRVNSELADILADADGSDRILLDLEERNAFVVSLDSERRWFRYHHLFREMLRLELRRTLPSSIADLHKRAARWFEDNGHFVEAISHSQEAGDYELASRLLVDNLFDLILNGRHAVVRSLLDGFPRTKFLEHPELEIAKGALSIKEGWFAAATSELDVAERHTDTLPVPRQTALRVRISTLRLWLARQQGRLDRVVDQMRYLASAEADNRSLGATSNATLRAVALMNLGIVEMWSGQVVDAEKHLREGAALAKRIEQPFLEIMCLSHLALAVSFSSYAASRRHADEAMELAEYYGLVRETVVIPAITALGGAAAINGDLRGGEHWLDRALAIIKPDANPPTQLPVHVARGLLYAGSGRLHEALGEFESGERMQSFMLGEHVFTTQASAGAIAMKARLGMLDEARASLAAVEPAHADLASFRYADALISFLAEEPRGALGKLSDLVDGKIPATNVFIRIESHLLAAQSHRSLGDHTEQRRAVETALELAEPDRIILPFLMADVAELLEEHSRNGTSHPALLIHIMDIIAGSHSNAGVPKLSKTELRVLRYLPTHLSRTDIARELRVSVNTVNTHMRSIYAKLGVSKRTEAVKRARQMRAEQPAATQRSQ